MMSNADKGHEVREYFLACERRAQAYDDPIEKYPELRARQLLPKREINPAQTPWRLSDNGYLTTYTLSSTILVARHIN